MPPLRLFVALDLPPEIKAVITHFQTRLQATAPRNMVRWVDPSGTHLTLKYLGLTGLREQIEAMLDLIGPQQRPFALHITQPRAFPHSRQPRILWLGLGGDLPALSRLQHVVETHVAPLGFPTEPRIWTPHITLGRVKQSEQTRPLAADVGPTSRGPSPEWRVAKLVLMVSESGPHGPCYSPIHAVPFDAR